MIEGVVGIKTLLFSVISWILITFPLGSMRQFLALVISFHHTTALTTHSTSATFYSKQGEYPLFNCNFIVVGSQITRIIHKGRSHFTRMKFFTMKLFVHFQFKIPIHDVVY